MPRIALVVLVCLATAACQTPDQAGRPRGPGEQGHPKTVAEEVKSNAPPTSKQAEASPPEVQLRRQIERTESKAMAQKQMVTRASSLVATKPATPAPAISAKQTQAVNDVSLALAKEVVTQTHMASKALEAATHAGVPNTEAVTIKHQAVLTALTKVFPQLRVPAAPHMDKSVAAMLQSGAVVGKMALDEAQAHTKSVFSLIERLQHTYADHQHPLPKYFGKLKNKARRARNALDNLIKDDQAPPSDATANTSVVAAKSTSMAVLLAADQGDVGTDHLPAIPDSLYGRRFEVASEVAMGKKPTEVTARASGVELPEPVMPPKDPTESKPKYQPPWQWHEKTQHQKPHERNKPQLHSKREKQLPRDKKQIVGRGAGKRGEGDAQVEFDHRRAIPDQKADLPTYATSISEHAESLAAAENKKLELLAAWERRSVEARAATKAQAAQISAADAALQSARAASNKTRVVQESAAANLSAALDAESRADLLAKEEASVSQRTEKEMTEASIEETRAKHAVDFTRIELNEADVSRAATSPEHPARFREAVSCPPHPPLSSLVFWQAKSREAQQRLADAQHRMGEATKEASKVLTQRGRLYQDSLDAEQRVGAEGRQKVELSSQVEASRKLFESMSKELAQVAAQHNELVSSEQAALAEVKKAADRHEAAARQAESATEARTDAVTLTKASEADMQMTNSAKAAAAEAETMLATATKEWDAAKVKADETTKQREKVAKDLASKRKAAGAAQEHAEGVAARAHDVAEREAISKQKVVESSTNAKRAKTSADVATNMKAEAAKTLARSEAERDAASTAYVGLQATLSKAALDADQAAKRAAEASEHAIQAYARLLAAESAARSKTALRESLAIKAEVVAKAHADASADEQQAEAARQVEHDAGQKSLVAMTEADTNAKRAKVEASLATSERVAAFAKLKAAQQELEMAKESESLRTGEVSAYVNAAAAVVKALSSKPHAVGQLKTPSKVAVGIGNRDLKKTQNMLNRGRTMVKKEQQKQKEQQLKQSASGQHPSKKNQTSPLWSKWTKPKVQKPKVQKRVKAKQMKKIAAKIASAAVAAAMGKSAPKSVGMMSNRKNQRWQTMTPQEMEEDEGRYWSQVDQLNSVRHQARTEAREAVRKEKEARDDDTSKTKQEEQKKAQSMYLQRRMQGQALQRMQAQVAAATPEAPHPDLQQRATSITRESSDAASAADPGRTYMQLRDAAAKAAKAGAQAQVVGQTTYPMASSKQVQLLQMDPYAGFGLRAVSNVETSEPPLGVSLGHASIQEDQGGGGQGIGGVDFVSGAATMGGMTGTGGATMGADMDTGGDGGIGIPPAPPLILDIPPAPPSPPRCKPWCFQHPKPWDDKCDFNLCKDCSPCLPAVYIAPPSPPATNDSTYGLMASDGVDHDRAFTELVRSAAADAHAGLARNVTLVSLCVPPMSPEACSVSHANLRAYAAKHGYGTRLFSSLPESLAAPARKPSWYKLPLLQSVLEAPGVKTAVWLDPTSLVMNLSLPLPLEQMLPVDRPEVQLAHGADKHCFVKAEPLAVRRGDFAAAFLREAWTTYPAPGFGRETQDQSVWGDRASMAYLLGGARQECRKDVANVVCCSLGAHKYAASSSTNKYASAAVQLPGRGWSGSLVAADPSERYTAGDLLLNLPRGGSEHGAAMLRFHKLAEQSDASLVANALATRQSELVSP